MPIVGSMPRTLLEMPRLPVGAKAAAGDRGWKVVLGVATVLALAYFLFAGEPRPQAVLFTLGQAFASLAVFGAVVVYRPPNAGAWTIMGIGLGLVAAGTAISLGVPAFDGALPYPSIADVFYISGYLVIIVAVVRLLASAISSRPIDATIDALIVTVAIGLVSWAMIIDPIVDAGGTPGVALLVSLAYPLLDVLILGLVVGLLFTAGQKLPALWLIVIAMVFNTVSDLGLAAMNASGGYRPGTIIDLGWWIAVAGWAAAAAHPSMSRFIIPAATDPGVASRRRMLFLGIAALVPAGVIAYQQFVGTAPIDIDIDVGGTIAITALVMYRLSRMVSELRRTLLARSVVEQTLAFRTLHDPLTGLGNRVKFAQQLDGLLAAGWRSIAVLFCDLDDFKNVNDTLGHPIGDALLVAVGARIDNVMRPDDLAARLGGDEFAILLRGVRREETAIVVADRIRATLAEPISINGHTLLVGASIGIALMSTDTRDALELMRNADIAMYLAKSGGKGRAEVYRSSMHADVLRRLTLRADLEQAVEEHQFSVAYQPIVDLATGQLEGAEALARWEHPTRGQLPPSDFIPLAESTGLIVPLGRWILEQACQQAAAWQRERGDRPFSMAVNISTRQIDEPGFVDSVARALSVSGLRPDRLTLEITETALADATGAERVLNELRAMGVRTALDDFGTGYSSLNYIQRFPIDVIKIDRSFVMVLDEAGNESTVLSAIVDLATQLHMQTIAEGIESPAQLEKVQALGCTFGQG